MFKNRLFLSGIGIGLITGSLLLQLMNVGAESANPQPSNKVSLDELDVNQLKQQAERYFQVFSKDEKVYTAAQTDKILAEQKEKLNATAPKPELAEPQPQVKQTVIYVEEGYKAEYVGQLLVKAGIIPDAKAFEQELIRQQKLNRIQVGAHLFGSKLDLSDVVDKLTTKP